MVVDDRILAAVTPENAGWSYAGLGIVVLPPYARYEFDTGPDEVAVIPLVGSVTVAAEADRLDLEGRADVFSSTTDFAYLPCNSSVYLESTTGGEFALARARASDQLDPAYGPKRTTQVTVRGAGACTRQVNNIITADTFRASKLLVVEVLSPGGNWSSYPPHKHDEDRPPDEVSLEEIYYFRTRDRAGFGVHRLYRDDDSLDLTHRVGHGDVFLIPDGYHGPTIAGPGYDLYYLNVLAGPSEGRAMTPSFDPEHEAIRRRWEHEQADPRVPFYE